MRRSETRAKRRRALRRVDAHQLLREQRDRRRRRESLSLYRRDSFEYRRNARLGVPRARGVVGYARGFRIDTFPGERRFGVGGRGREPSQSEALRGALRCTRLARLAPKCP